MEMIMTEENNWDDDKGGNAVGGTVDCASR